MKFPMKRTLGCLLLAAVNAMATQVGDTYQQVIAQRGEPKSQIADGTSVLLIYADASIELKNQIVVSVDSLRAGSKMAPAAVASPRAIELPTHEQMVADLKQQLSTAISAVQKIVNQPVASQPRTRKMEVATYPGWFHAGAITPDFNNVDVRKTQQFDYDVHPFIASTSSPDVVYVGSDVEFNPMTKLFYTDRSVPKKKLTEAEMVEINRLYRVIGRCEMQLNQLTPR
jgi:hypothetical protein